MDVLVKEYFVTNNPNLTHEPLISSATVESLDWLLEKQTVVRFDTETTGLFWYKDELLTYQFGFNQNSIRYKYTVDATTVPIRRFQRHLKRLTLIIHNAKFDLGFLYKHNIYPNSIIDSFLQERIVTCGIDSHKRDYKSCVFRYVSPRDADSLDKEIRKNLTEESLADINFIKYCGYDVDYGHKISAEQQTLINYRKLDYAVKIDNSFVKCLAYIERCGFLLDQDKWIKKMSHDQLALDGFQKKLDDFVINLDNPDFIDYEIKEGTEISIPTINWNSPKQVLEILGAIQIFPTTIDKKTKKHKPSVAATVIGNYRDDYPIIDIYIRYKETAKRCGAYGENYLRLSMEGADDRVRTMFTQIMNTGRMSSGAANLKLVNFQNIPSIHWNYTNEGIKYVESGWERLCFKPATGNVFIVADYSQQEQVIMANKSQDAGLLAFFRTGGGDMHSFVAQCMYPKLAGLPLKEIKDNHKDLRQNAKAVGFAINYGGSAQTVADNMGCSLEEAESIVSAYFKAFPGVSSYMDKQKKKAWEQGYVLINPISGRKVYFSSWRMNRRSYRKIDWIKYNEEKAQPIPSKYFQNELRPLVRKLAAYRASIQKKSLNYPIQGCLPADSQILTRDGYISIGDFISGEVWTGEKWAKAIQVNKGPATRMRLHLSDGRTFDCDDRHIMLCKTDTAYPQWIHIDELEGKELVRSAEHITDWGQQYLTEEDWYWAGRLIGDGFVGPNGYWGITFNMQEQDKRKEFEKFLVAQNIKSRKTGSKGYSLDHGDSTVSVRIAAQDSYRIYESWHIPKESLARTKRIPKVVFTLDKKRREQFLFGWYDADGRKYTSRGGIHYEGRHLTRLTTCNHELAKDGLRLMATLGLTGTISKESDKSGTSWYSIYFHTTPHSVFVEKVEDLAIQEEMYTLSVDDERHSFANEGLISKNTASDMLKCAAVMLFIWIQDNDLIDKVLIPNIVHDEIVVESPEEISRTVRNKLEECMNKAGKIFCKSVPCTADANITQTWDH